MMSPRVAGPTDGTGAAPEGWRTADSPMHPLLARTLDAIEGATADLSTEALERHPPGKWSPAEILEHLALTFDGTRRNFQRCLDTGTRRAGPRTLRQRLAVLLIVELGRFPAGVAAPERTRPVGVRADAVLRLVRDNLAGMDAAMRASEGRFGRRRPIASHPALGPLTVRQWRRFHWVHVRHHLEQIH